VVAVVVATLLDNPRSSAIVLLVMLAGVPVYFVWRRLFSHPLP
jgi:APA family basic amino acid/polyamine antiporter